MSPSFLGFHDVAPDGHATSIPLHLCPHPPSASSGVPQQQVTQLWLGSSIMGICQFPADAIDLAAKANALVQGLWKALDSYEYTEL
jgi:hypothetical protein